MSFANVGKKSLPAKFIYRNIVISAPAVVQWGTELVF